MKEEYPNNNFGRFFDKHPNFAKSIDIYSGKYAIKYLKQDKAFMKKLSSSNNKHQTVPTKDLKAFIKYDTNKIKHIDPRKAYTGASLSPTSNNNKNHDMNDIDPLSGMALEQNMDMFMNNNRKHFSDENQIYHFQKDIHRDDLTTSEAITDANSHMLHINHQLRHRNLPKAFQTNNVDKLKQYMNSPQITATTANQLAQKRAYSMVRNQANYVDAHGNVDNTMRFSTKTDVKLKVRHSVHSQMQRWVQQQDEIGKGNGTDRAGNSRAESPDSSAAKQTPYAQSDKIQSKTYALYKDMIKPRHKKRYQKKYTTSHAARRTATRATKAQYTTGQAPSSTRVNTIHLGTHALNQFTVSTKRSTRNDTVRNANEAKRTKHQSTSVVTPHGPTHHIGHHPDGFDIE